MGCKSGQCYTTSTLYGIFILTQSLEGCWPTKAKETLPSHEVRLTPLDTSPVFQCLRKELLSSLLLVLLL